MKYWLSMNVVYKSAGKYKQLRGTRAGANCVKAGIIGVVYSAVVGGAIFLAVPGAFVKPFDKPCAGKETMFPKTVQEVRIFNLKNDKNV